MHDDEGGSEEGEEYDDEYYLHHESLQWGGTASGGGRAHLQTVVTQETLVREAGGYKLWLSNKSSSGYLGVYRERRTGWRKVEYKKVEASACMKRQCLRRLHRKRGAGWRVCDGGGGGGDGWRRFMTCSMMIVTLLMKTSNAGGSTSSSRSSLPLLPYRRDHEPCIHSQTSAGSQTRSLFAQGVNRSTIWRRRIISFTMGLETRGPCLEGRGRGHAAVVELLAVPGALPEFGDDVYRVSLLAVRKDKGRGRQF